MANTNLTGTYYQVPENIISEITNTLKTCEEGDPGKKKAEFLVREKKLSYENLRRYKNFFDNYNRSKYDLGENDTLSELNPEMDYKLRGGKLMRDFVENKLKEITEKIKNSKQIKRDYAGLDNQFKKEKEHSNLKINTDNNFIKSESLIREGINIDNEIEEIERTVDELKDNENIILSVDELANQLKNSKESVLSSDIWKKLENTDSNEVKKGDWDYVYNIAKMYEKTDPEILKRSIQNDSYERPLIIKLKNRFILVAGNTRLCAASAMGVNPKVIIADVDNLIKESIIKESSNNKPNKMMRVSLTVIFNNDNKILLLKRSENTDWCPNCWALVGGKIEKNESPEEGLVREVKEETDINLEKYKLKKIIKFNNVLEYLYISKVDNDFVELNTEHSDYKWYSLDEIKDIENKVPKLLNYIKYVIL
jgi:8-oxo-dGTP diphosphatase